jgi:methionyl-tRNA formyltransferase
MQILYFGMYGQFSLYPLQALLRAGRQIAGVIIPGHQEQVGRLPQPVRKASVASEAKGTPQDIISLALDENIPVWQVGSLSKPANVELLTGFKPDVICVACFSKILPAAVLALPRFGCLNLHPSLLPAYRGPEPLFWIAYHDERTGGVSLHWLESSIDSGDIVRQESIARYDGMTGCELERQCAEVGGKLLVEALTVLDRTGKLLGRPQPTKGASYFKAPSVAAMVIRPDWPARRAFNFVQGAEQWPLRIEIGETQYRIRTAKSYAADQQLDRPFVLLADELWVQMNPGVLLLKIWAD